MRKTSKNWVTLREVVAASRYFSWINTAAPFLVGAYLGQPRLSVPLVIGIMYFLLPYNLLVYGVNDIYDYESDINNPRKGGIEGGIMPKQKHRSLWAVILLTNLPFIFYLLAQGSAVSKFWFFGVIFMALSYSVKGLRFKEIPFLDSFNSSWHFWSPFVYGLLLSGSEQSYMPAIVAFMFWGIASHSLGAIQDIKYDRQAGIGSVAAFLGAEKTGLFSVSFYLAAAILPSLYYGWSGIAASLVLMLYVGNVLLCFKKASEAVSYRRAWKVFMKLNLLAGFFFTIILIAAYYPL